MKICEKCNIVHSGFYQGLSTECPMCKLEKILAESYEEKKMISDKFTDYIKSVESEAETIIELKRDLKLMTSNRDDLREQLAQAKIWQNKKQSMLGAV